MGTYHWMGCSVKGLRFGGRRENTSMKAELAATFAQDPNHADAKRGLKALVDDKGSPVSASEPCSGLPHSPPPNESFACGNAHSTRGTDEGQKGEPEEIDKVGVSRHDDSDSPMARKRPFDTASKSCQAITEFSDFEVIQANERTPGAPPKRKHPSLGGLCSCDKRGLECGSSACENRMMRYECTGSTCSVGKSRCRNRCMQKREWKGVEVRPAGAKGFGLFAQEDLEEDCFVLEYLGEIIGESDFIRRSSQSNSKNHRYFMQLDDGEYLDPSRRGSIARFCNHSCEPNSMMQVWTVRGELRVCVFTKKEILSGQELTFDYAWEPMARRPLTKCLCGTPSCRKFIEDWISFDENPAAHRTGLWEIPSGVNLVFHQRLAGHGVEWKSTTSQDASRVFPDPPMLVDRRVRVWWEGEQAWYEADVVGYDETTKTHTLQYCVDADHSEEHLWAYLDKNRDIRYNGEGDLCYFDDALGKEVKMSAWELLNEDIDESGQRVSCNTPFFIPKRKLSANPKKPLREPVPSRKIDANSMGPARNVSLRPSPSPHLSNPGPRVVTASADAPKTKAPPPFIKLQWDTENVELSLGTLSQCPAVISKDFTLFNHSNRPVAFRFSPQKSAYDAQWNQIYEICQKHESELIRTLDRDFVALNLAASHLRYPGLPEISPKEAVLRSQSSTRIRCSFYKADLEAISRLLGCPAVDQDHVHAFCSTPVSAFFSLDSMTISEEEMVNALRKPSAASELFEEYWEPEHAIPRFNCQNFDHHRNQIFHSTSSSCGMASNPREWHTAYDDELGHSWDKCKSSEGEDHRLFGVSANPLACRAWIDPSYLSQRKPEFSRGEKKKRKRHAEDSSDPRVRKDGKRRGGDDHHSEVSAIKNAGDLSKDALKAGWRMKISASKQRPYYYHKRNPSETFWSRKEVDARVRTWAKEQKEKKTPHGVEKE